jgi:hypothetical protein
MTSRLTSGVMIGAGITSGLRPMPCRSCSSSVGKGNHAPLSIGISRHLNDRVARCTRPKELRTGIARTFGPTRYRPRTQVPATGSRSNRAYTARSRTNSMENRTKNQPPFFVIRSVRRQHAGCALVASLGSRRLFTPEPAEYVSGIETYARSARPVVPTIPCSDPTPAGHATAARRCHHIRRGHSSRQIF